MGEGAQQQGNLMIWKCEGQENLDYSKFYKLFIIEK